MPREQDSGECDERRREAEHRCDRSGDDHPEQAAHDRRGCQRAAEAQSRHGERDDADEQGRTRQRGEVRGREERRLPPSDGSSEEDVGAEELRHAGHSRTRAPARDRPQRREQLASAPHEQRHRRSQQRVLGELRGGHPVRAPRIRGGMRVAVCDLDEHPGDEQRACEPEQPTLSQRAESLAQAAGERGQHHGQHPTETPG